MTEKKAKKDKDQNFEDSLTRLEAIVADMEGGDLSIEKMMTYFEEGQGLIAFCSKKLNTALHAWAVWLTNPMLVLKSSFCVSGASTPRPPK